MTSIELLCHDFGGILKMNPVMKDTLKVTTPDQEDMEDQEMEIQDIVDIMGNKM